ncbi:MAG: hypothetical protein ACYSWZ_02485 [Planctomycetota bacterium]
MAMVWLMSWTWLCLLNVGSRDVNDELVAINHYILSYTNREVVFRHLERQDAASLTSSRTSGQVKIFL